MNDIQIIITLEIPKKFNYDKDLLEDETIERMLNGFGIDWDYLKSIEIHEMEDES